MTHVNPPKMKFSPLNILLVCLSLGVLVFYVFFVDGVQNIITTIQYVQVKWLLLGILLMVIFWYMETMCLHLPVKAFHPAQRFYSTFSTSMIGQYFNSITPFSSGGHPVQAYYMHKDGVAFGASLSSMLVKLIVYQFVLTLYSAIILIFQTSFFYHKIKGFVFLALVGFAINVIVIISLICMGYFKRIAAMIGSILVKVGVAFHLVHDQYNALRVVICEVNRFHRNYKRIRQKKGVVLQMILCTILQLTAYYAVTYTVYRSFNLTQADFFIIISAQAFVLLLSSVVPIPGGIGASEGSFYLILGIFFPRQYLPYAILAWRLITFYLPLIVGAGFTLLRRDSRESTEAS